MALTGVSSGFILLAMRRTMLLLLLVCFASIATTNLVAHKPTGTPASNGSSMQVESKAGSLTLTLDDLKSMPHITVTVHNRHTNADETYSGVRLADLLVKGGAPLGKDLHGEALANYVIAVGADGAGPG